MGKSDFQLELWGGQHYIKNDIYHLKRMCGLFSNITVMLYGIPKFIKNGYTPTNLSMQLMEYDNEINFYPLLFDYKNKVNLDDISEDEMNYFFRFTEPNYLGIGRQKCHLNFTILNRIIQSYFQLNDNILKIIKEIKEINLIDYENTVFIWARKTDKIVEIFVPEAERYIELYNSLHLNKRVIIQSDDITVYNDFNKLGFDYDNLNVIPVSNNNNGFHVNLNTISDDTFYEMYKMTKLNYLQKLLALMWIASKCHTVIIYPGNLCTLIPIIRGNWNNVHSFINNNNTME